MIMISCRSPSHQILLDHERATFGGAPVYFSPSLEVSKNPLFALCGTTEERRHANIHQELHRAALRVALDTDHEDHFYFLSSDLIDLRLYTPYFFIFDTGGLYRVMTQSLTGKGHGVGPLNFGYTEVPFLENEAIPEIVEAKIRQAKDRGIDVIRFGIKSLGIGSDGGEFPEVLYLLLNHLEERPEFQGAIGVECSGFEIDLSVIGKSWSTVKQQLNSVVRMSRVGSRVEVRYNVYYGDLANPVILPAMLAFGHTDIAIWRRTHLLVYGGVPLEYGYQIVNGMRTNLQHPGALLVRESAPCEAGGIFVGEVIR